MASALGVVPQVVMSGGVAKNQGVVELSVSGDDGRAVRFEVRDSGRGIAAAETGVELARQRYKPEFGVDLTYGGRSGNTLDCSPRSDLLSLMVVMDVPLFTRNRQDRVIAAQVAETSAVRYTLDDELRRMRSEIESQAAAQHRLEERLALFEETLLPQAEFSSEASMNAYRSSLVDLTTLLRAQITEFDLQSEYVRLKAEMLKTRARLHYLAGDAS